MPSQAAPSTPTPSVVQHVASSTNPAGVGISGNNFKIPMPNLVGAGNCLILGITYPNGAAPNSITDNNGNTWSTTPAVSADAGVGAYVSAIYTLANANAGLTTVTVGFAATKIPFNYTISEINAVATVTPVNGTHGAAGVAAPNLAAGSFTPGNNDANGGNVIWSYFALAGGAGDNPTNFAPGSGHTLLDGDITWTSNQGFPHASEWQTQSVSAAVNPGLTATGDSVNGYNCVSVALKVANAGTARGAGIKVAKILHFTNNAPTSAGGAQKFQIPSTGNLRVLATANNPGLTTITSVVDSEGNTWHVVPNPGGDCPQMFYWDGASVNLALTVTVNFSGTATYSFRYFDVVGAAVSAFDTSGTTSSTTADGLTTIQHQPDITPTTINGLVIAVMGLGQGPGLAVTSPSGGIWDLCTYTGEIDTDLMENADAVGHLYNSSTAAENWTWTITSQPSNTAFSTAAAFKAA